MEFYRLDAEHIRNKKVMLEKLEESFKLCLAGQDDMFDSMYVVVLHGSRKDAEAAREIMWEHNYGASCEISTLTEDEYDEMC